MKVLMLSWEFPPNIAGGLGRHVAELSPALAAQGAEVHVITPVGWIGHIGLARQENLIIHRVYAPALVHQASIRDQALRVNQALVEYAHSIAMLYGPYDLIHTHDWLTSFAAVDIQKRWHCPVIATIHATERGRGRGHLGNELQFSIDADERELVNAAQHIIVCSQYMANEVQYFFHVPTHKLTVIPNGVNADSLNHNVSPHELAQFRAKYAQPDEQIVFTVGRLVYEKGIHVLIQATPQILAACPTARIIVAGRGPEARSLEQQAEMLGVHDRVNFVGFITDEEKSLFFRSADCAIFPSLYEPFGIVALEAMALGCSVIVSDVGGLAEIVVHENTGIKIYPDSVDSTGWGIIHALTNPMWRERHATNALRTVEEKFTWERIASSTVKTYAQVVARHTMPTVSEQSSVV